jgi:hypothetical protein
VIRAMLDQIAETPSAFAHSALVGACLLARDKITSLDHAMRALIQVFEATWVGEGGSHTAFDNVAEVQIARRLIGDPS